MKASVARSTSLRIAEPTHIGDPSKDVGVEADVVLRDVETALQEDLSLKRTAVVCGTKEANVRN